MKFFRFLFLGLGVVFSCVSLSYGAEEDSSYYLDPTSSENIYVLKNQQESSQDHLVFLPSAELALELAEVPQSLELASAPVVLAGGVGVASLPLLGKGVLRGVWGSGKKVLLTVVGVGSVVGYLWNKLHGASSLEELGVFLSAGETEGEASPSSSKWTDDGFASDPHSPDPKSIPFLWHKDFVEQQISAEGAVSPEYLPLASQGYDYALAVLGIVVAIKSLEQVAGHFKYDPDISNPDFHKDFFEGALSQLSEEGYSLQEAKDLIFDPQTGKPQDGLGVMYESPYAPMLLSTMARLEVLKKEYGLSAQGVDRIYEWWLSSTSFERANVLELFSSSDAFALPMRLLAGAQKLAYTLQSWDVNSDLAHRQDEGAMTYPLIMEFENDAASKFDVSLSSFGETYVEMNRDVRSFHRNKQVLAETSPGAAVFEEKSIDEITKDDFIGYRDLAAQARRHNLYLGTFLELHQIYQASKDPWYRKKLAELKVKASSPE